MTAARDSTFPGRWRHDYQLDSYNASQVQPFVPALAHPCTTVVCKSIQEHLDRDKYLEFRLRIFGDCIIEDAIGHLLHSTCHAVAESQAPPIRLGRVLGPVPRCEPGRGEDSGDKEGDRIQVLFGYMQSLRGQRYCNTQLRFPNRSLLAGPPWATLRLPQASHHG